MRFFPFAPVFHQLILKSQILFQMLFFILLVVEDHFSLLHLVVFSPVVGWMTDPHDSSRSALAFEVSLVAVVH